MKKFLVCTYIIFLAACFQNTLEDYESNCENFGYACWKLGSVNHSKSYFNLVEKNALIRDSEFYLKKGCFDHKKKYACISLGELFHMEELNDTKLLSQFKDTSRAELPDKNTMKHLRLYKEKTLFVIHEQLFTLCLKNDLKACYLLGYSDIAVNYIKLSISKKSGLDDDAKAYYQQVCKKYPKNQEACNYKD